MNSVEGALLSALPAAGGPSRPNVLGVARAVRTDRGEGSVGPEGRGAK